MLVEARRASYVALHAAPHWPARIGQAGGGIRVVHGLSRCVRVHFRQAQARGSAGEGGRTSARSTSPTRCSRRSKGQLPPPPRPRPLSCGWRASSLRGAHDMLRRRRAPRQSGCEQCGGHALREPGSGALAIMQSASPRNAQLRALAGCCALPHRFTSGAPPHRFTSRRILWHHTVTLTLTLTTRDGGPRRAAAAAARASPAARGPPARQPARSRSAASSAPAPRRGSGSARNARAGGRPRRAPLEPRCASAGQTADAPSTVSIGTHTFIPSSRLSGDRAAAGGRVLKHPPASRHRGAGVAARASRAEAPLLPGAGAALAARAAGDMKRRPKHTPNRPSTASPGTCT